MNGDIEPLFTVDVTNADVCLAAAVDPCNKPEFCISGQRLPNPENCTQYFVCDASLKWSLATCVNFTLFNNVSLTCVSPSQATCQQPCAPYTGIPTTTLSPGKQ